MENSLKGLVLPPISSSNRNSMPQLNNDCVRIINNSDPMDTQHTNLSSVRTSMVNLTITNSPRDLSESPSQILLTNNRYNKARYRRNNLKQKSHQIFNTNGHLPRYDRSKMMDIYCHPVLSKIDTPDPKEVSSIKLKSCKSRSKKNFIKVLANNESQNSNLTLI